MLIYRGNKLIAGSKDNNDDTLLRLIDFSDLSEQGIPWGLFGPSKNRRTEIKMGHVKKTWLKDRIVPENRLNISDVLASMGLKEYEFYNVVRASKAREVNDEFWVDWDGFVND